MKSTARILAVLIAAGGLAAGLLGTAPARASTTWQEVYLAHYPAWCLTSDYNHPVAGTQVFLYSCYPGHTNQTWGFTLQPGGVYLIQYDIDDSNTGAPLCLAVPNNNSSDGIQFELWTCENTSAEKFSVSGLVIRDYSTGETLADYGYYLQDYNPVITWHYVAGAGYEQWS